MDLDPVVLSEPVDVVAPVVTDALAAQLGSAAGAGLSSKGSHSTYQPLVLGLLDLVGEDVA